MGQRHSNYESRIKPRLEEIGYWCRDGLIDSDIAGKLGISYGSLRNYRDKHPELAEILRNSKDAADYKVENSLFKRACGFKETVKKKSILKNGEIVGTVDEVYYPPDTLACIFWLKNRRRDLWKDRPPESSENAENELKKLIEAIQKSGKK